MEQSQADEVMGRIKGTLDYKDFADCDLVIEAITEDLDLKLEMWKELDGIVSNGALFATNTSSLSVVNQAAVTKRPERFIGLHFFNPAQVMPLLEVVESITSGREALDAGLRVRQEPEEDRRARTGQDGLHRQPSADPVPVRCDPRLRGGLRHDRADRRRDEGRRQPPDGPVRAARLRRARHEPVGGRDHVRRVPRAARRAATDAAQAGRRRPSRAQVGPRLLRLLR